MRGAWRRACPTGRRWRSATSRSACAWRASAPSIARARSRAALGAGAAVAVSAGGGAATLALGRGGDDGDAPSSWWARLGVVLPIVALVAGLMLIQYQHARLRAAAIAEIDVDLLVDELPPRAYSDPGFVEFLKTARQ